MQRDQEVPVLGPGVRIFCDMIVLVSWGMLFLDMRDRILAHGPPPGYREIWRGHGREPCAGSRPCEGALYKHVSALRKANRLMEMGKWEAHESHPTRLYKLQII